MRTTRILAASATLFLAMGSMAFGQATDQPQPQPQPQPGGDPNRQGRGDRGGNREEFRQRYEARMKELMGTTDDEWKVLQPRIERVQQLSRATSAGRGGMGLLFGGGRGGPGGGGGDRDRNRGPGGGDTNTPPSPVAESSRALQTAVENKDTSNPDLKARITAYREARTKARADLTKAQDELRELLTARQEAVLVVMGVLE